MRHGPRHILKDRQGQRLKPKWLNDAADAAHKLVSDRRRSLSQPGRRVRVSVPTQIRHQPGQNLKTAFPLFALDPLYGDFRDLPSQAMTFDEELNAVREALGGFNIDPGEKPA